MPYVVEDRTRDAGRDAARSFADGQEPALVATLWPHRSLSPRGFVYFIAVTAVMLAIPLLALVGRSALWAVLPWLLAALALVWHFLRRSDRDLRMSEVLKLWDDRIEIVRTEADGTVRQWDANPHWVEVGIRAEGGPVPQYLTLRGNQRRVELGAFLSPEERPALYRLINAALARRG